jgi:hypothetical protein
MLNCADMLDLGGSRVSIYRVNLVSNAKQIVAASAQERARAIRLVSYDELEALKLVA